MGKAISNFDHGADDPFAGLEILDADDQIGKEHPTPPLPPQSLRKNSYGGKCSRCGVYIVPMGGVLLRDGGRWLVQHEGDCPITAESSTRISEDGMYQMPDGKIVKVQVAVHGSGEFYAKRLEISDDGEHGAEIAFVYEKGLVSKLTPDMKMPLEKAQEFGRLYGVCCVCARTLTNETSIANGIGPICGASF